MAKKFKIPQEHIDVSSMLLKILGVTDFTKIDSTGCMRHVPARVRLSRGQKKGCWSDETLCLQFYRDSQVVCIVAVDSRDWAEYHVQQYDKGNAAWFCEDYVMEIDHPGRVPDEVHERLVLEQQAAMQASIQRNLGTVHFR